jgi:hypothetical protein
METKRAFCIDDFPRMLPTKFLFNWQNGFREDHFYKSANQTEQLPVVDIFGTKLAILIEDLPRMLPTEFQFIWESSFREEDY